jgi:hypothetical protein
MAQPPQIARSLLSIALPQHVREHVLDDPMKCSAVGALETHHERAAGTGAKRCRFRSISPPSQLWELHRADLGYETENRFTLALPINSGLAGRGSLGRRGSPRIGRIARIPEVRSVRMVVASTCGRRDSRIREIRGIREIRFPSTCTEDFLGNALHVSGRARPQEARRRIFTKESLRRASSVDPIKALRAE